MTWITTNTSAGPLTTDNYYFTITGLSASTIYQYRAYFIVDGVEYYGNILTGTTAAITLYNPTVTTGDISGSMTTSGFNVYYNNITNTGGASIIEHGILYTQQAIYGNDTGLVYSNFPNVCKVSSFSGVTSIPYTYSAKTNNLIPNTLTYYRAYAKNAHGVGYGIVKESGEIIPNVNIDIKMNWVDANSDETDGFGGVIELRCCNNSLVDSYSIAEYSKSVIVSNLWVVPFGCYYIDYSKITSKICGTDVLTKMIWYDTNTTQWINDRKFKSYYFSENTVVCSNFMESPIYVDLNLHWDNMTLTGATDGFRGRIGVDCKGIGFQYNVCEYPITNYTKSCSVESAIEVPQHGRYIVNFGYLGYYINNDIGNISCNNFYWSDCINSGNTYCNFGSGCLYETEVFLSNNVINIYSNNEEKQTVSVATLWNYYNMPYYTYGFDGTLKLMCCDGSLVRTINYNETPYNRNTNCDFGAYNLSTGCYYIDFSEIVLRFNDVVQPTYDNRWYFNHGSSCGFTTDMFKVVDNNTNNTSLIFTLPCKSCNIDIHAYPYNPIYGANVKVYCCDGLNLTSSPLVYDSGTKGASISILTGDFSNNGCYYVCFENMGNVKWCGLTSSGTTSTTNCFTGGNVIKLSNI